MTLQDLFLQQLSIAPSQSVEELAGKIGTTQGSVHSLRYTLKQKGLLDQDNALTSAGRDYVAKLQPAEDRPSTRAPKSGARKKKPKQSSARHAPMPIKSVPLPVPASRLEAAHRVADSVIANARNAHRVLRAYLEEELVQITPLLESLLDNCAGSLTLIEQTYHAAR